MFFEKMMKCLFLNLHLIILSTVNFTVNFSFLNVDITLSYVQLCIFYRRLADL
jgi:hypothetical protein